MSKIGDLIRNTNEVILVPEIFDCASAKAADLNGFKVIMISSADLANSLCGVPDGFISLDEIIRTVERISSMTEMPVIMDSDYGYGTPLNCYYGVKRIAKAGAAGVLITDAHADGRPGMVSPELAALRFKAARDALGDDDALLIARCDANPETDFNETVERCNIYLEAGANMTCILNMHLVKGNRTELCRKLSEQIPGWKWYPDLTADEHGNPEVNLDDLFDLGYRMTGIHFSMHASMIAMLDTGRHVLKNRDNVYVTKHYDYTGYRFFSPTVFFGILPGDRWRMLEEKYVPEDQRILKRAAEYFCRDDDCYDPDK